MSERDQIHNYLNALERYLSSLEAADAFEVKREIESHIYDTIDTYEQRGESVDIQAILSGFGPPRVLAESYIGHIKLGAPPPAGFNAIKTVKRGVTRSLYYGMTLFGFGIASFLILTGFANLIVPDLIGVSVSKGGESVVISFLDSGIAASDASLGFWYSPIAVLFGYAIIRLTIGINRVLKRQLIIDQVAES